MLETISDKSLTKHTGRAWQEWISILNKAGAKNWDHRTIVAHLKTKHKQSAWWQQMIANGYEVSTGKRIAGQSLKGTYSATLTKTVPVSSQKVWRWLKSEQGIEFWLKPLSPLQLKPGEVYEVDGGIFGEVRTVKPGARIRLTWQDGEWEKHTVVQVSVYPRSEQKTMLVIQHDGLQTAKLKSDLRVYWRKIINEAAIQISRG